ncbi:MAG: Uma2 family endonuclease, partial [Blastocatellia bacterium]|nr:Uma2 family endonuclease [Blastocatellia bacterium]
LYSYPDLMVVCGEMQFLDENRDVIINPKVIIEVASPSTEAFDYGEKFLLYRTFNPSLTDYLIVAQDRTSIEHFALREDGLWMIADSVVDLSGRVHITSINCDLQLAEVYDRVEFPEEEEGLDEE